MAELGCVLNQAQAAFASADHSHNSYFKDLTFCSTSQLAGIAHADMVRVVILFAVCMIGLGCLPS